MSDKQFADEKLEKPTGTDYRLEYNPHYLVFQLDSIVDRLKWLEHKLTHDLETEMETYGESSSRYDLNYLVDLRLKLQDVVPPQDKDVIPF